MSVSQVSLQVLVNRFDYLVRRLAIGTQRDGKVRGIFVIVGAVHLQVQVLHLKDELGGEGLDRVVVLYVEHETLRLALAQLEESCRLTEVCLIAIVHFNSHLNHLSVRKNPFVSHKAK